MIKNQILGYSVMVMISIIIACNSIRSQSKTNPYSPDLQDENLWDFKNGTTAVNIENGGINLTSKNALMVLKDFQFSEGTIEFDVKGRDVFQQSFPGIAFHIQNYSIYDVVYFRPFNFIETDSIKKYRSVQYMSTPKYEWPYLRSNFPLKYENKVNPMPRADEWFHAKVVIDNRKIFVFVNNSSVPSLVTEKLTQTNSGELGLWDSGGKNDSDASFKNLVITPKRRK